MWAQNITSSKSSDAAIIAQQRAFLDKENQKFASILSRSNLSSFNLKPKFTLRKLPFWGQSDPHRLDFEWPTHTLLDQMPASASLRSLEFKSCLGGPIASVRVNLTHGFSSRVFEKHGGRFEGHQTMRFDLKQAIKKVQGADQNGSLPCIYRLSLMDKDDKQLRAYDPCNSIGLYAGQVHQLGDNEELIGVYGQLQQNSFLSAFGFIVKVWLVGEEDESKA